MKKILFIFLFILICFVYLNNKPQEVVSNKFVEDDGSSVYINGILLNSDLQNTIIVNPFKLSTLKVSNPTEDTFLIIDGEEIYLPTNEQESFLMEFQLLPKKYIISYDQKTYGINYLFLEDFSWNTVPQSWVYPDSTDNRAWTIKKGKLSFNFVPQNYDQQSFASRYKISNQSIVEYTLRVSSDDFLANLYFLNNDHNVRISRNQILFKNSNNEMSAEFKIEKNRAYRIKVIRNQSRYEVYAESISNNYTPNELYVFTSNPVLVVEEFPIQSGLDNFGFSAWKGSHEFTIDNVIFGEYE